MAVNYIYMYSTYIETPEPPLCSSNDECQNGGTCHVDDTCVCSAGFTGTYCAMGGLH